MKKLLLACALGFCLPLASHAAQITIGNSTSGQATFQGSAGAIVTTLSAITGSASDSLGGIGTYTLSAFGPVTAAANGTGNWKFGTGVTDTFTYTSGANTLSETFTYTGLFDGSPNPHFSGMDAVTAVGGSAAFVTAFGGVGRTSTFDFATLAVGTVLDTLAGTSASESVGISSGEVVPNPPRIPEPGTLAILGTGLLGLGWLRSRRHRSR